MADKKSKVSDSEPTPAPNSGASSPVEINLTQPPLIDGVVAEAKQSFEDAVSGKAAADWNRMALAAANGDPAAQHAMAQNSLGMAMGSLHASPGGSLTTQAEAITGKEVAKGFGDKLASSKALMEETYGKLVAGEATQAQFAAAQQKYSAALDQATRHSSQVKGYAEGGEVESSDPLAGTPPPPGMEQAIAQGPAPASVPTDSLAGTPPPPGMEDAIKDVRMEREYGGMGQQAAAFAEGAVEGALPLGAGTKALSMLGDDPERMRERREYHPGTNMAGQMTGLVGSEFIPGVGQANLLSKAGKAGAAAIGLAAPVSTAAKIGSMAVKGIIENAIYQGGDEIAKHVMGDPDQTVDSVITDIGLSGLIGGTVGGGLGAVSPLWKAAQGTKAGQFLQSFADRLGGIEGDAAAPVIERGFEVAPEIAGAASGKEGAARMGKVLEQSDTTYAGRKYQESLTEARNNAGEKLAQTLGRDSEYVRGLPDDLSKSQAGKKVGDAIAERYEQTQAPLAKDFEKLRTKYEGQDLIPATITDDFSNPYSPKKVHTGGTLENVADSLGKLADDQGWLALKGSDELKVLNDALGALPTQKTIKDLDNLQSAIGRNHPPEKGMGGITIQTPKSRAATLVRKVIQEHIDETAMAKLGAEGPELVELFRSSKAAYRAQSLLREEFDARMRTGASTSNFGKVVRELAKTDGEAFIDRFSGKNDASFLPFLEQNFPEAAQSIRDHHIDKLLKEAAKKASSPDELLNPNTFLTQLERITKDSPELRQFILKDDAYKAVKETAEMLKELQKVPHNFSNTARTADALGKYTVGSATGVISLLMGVNPASAALIAAASHVLGKEAPDAVRLAMLKFMGSNKPIESEAFKAMAQFISSTIKGQNKLAKATEAVFKSGKEVLPEALMPSPERREKLDKQLKNIQKAPEALLNVGGKTGHYMPEHGTAVAATSARVTNYLNSIRPVPTKAAPLDEETEPSEIQKDKYHNALDIADQPLLVVKRIKDGDLTSDDVGAINAMYPTLSAQLRQKLTGDMIKHVSADDPVNYNTLMSLSLFMGQPLDSTMTPQAIMAAQPMPVHNKQPGGAEPKGVKHSTSKLDKMASSYRTPSQARMAEKSRGK